MCVYIYIYAYIFIFYVFYMLRLVHNYIALYYIAGDHVDKRIYLENEEHEKVFTNSNTCYKNIVLG